MGTVLKQLYLLLLLPILGTERTDGRAGAPHL